MCDDFIPDIENYSGRPPAFIRLHLELCQLKSLFTGTFNGSPAEAEGISIQSLPFSKTSEVVWRGLMVVFILMLRVRGKKHNPTIGVTDPILTKIFSTLFHANVDLSIWSAKIWITTRLQQRIVLPPSYKEKIGVEWVWNESTAWCFANLEATDKTHLSFAHVVSLLPKRQLLEGY